jgi:hypothetical protein
VEVNGNPSKGGGLGIEQSVGVERSWGRQSSVHVQT